MKAPIFPVFALKTVDDKVFIGGGGGNEHFGKKNGIVLLDETTYVDLSYFKTEDIILGINTYKPGVNDLELQEDELDWDEASDEENVVKEEEKVSSVKSKNNETVSDEVNSDNETSSDVSPNENVSENKTIQDKDVLYLTCRGTNFFYFLKLENRKFSLIKKIEKAVTKDFLINSLFLIINEELFCIYDIIKNYNELDHLVKKKNKRMDSFSEHEEYLYTLYKKNDKILVEREGGKTDIPEHWVNFFICEDKIHKVTKENNLYTFVYKKQMYRHEKEIGEMVCTPEMLIYYLKGHDSQLLFIIDSTTVFEIPKITCMSVNEDYTTVGTGDGVGYLFKGCMQVCSRKLCDYAITGISYKDGCFYFSSYNGLVDRKPILSFMRFILRVRCVYCLYGHPGRKNKLKYLVDHNVTAHTLDWPRAQQIYEIFRPITMPLLEGKVTPITVDIEQLFLRILALLPSECDPQKYVPEIEKYIKGIEKKLPTIPPLLPYKMKDIYFLLGDFYFKKEDTKQSVKFNMLDVVVNNDRLESWAEISLAKSNNVERILNSCKNLNNERDFLNPAKCIIRCYKRALEIKPSHCNMWIEYGIFVYAVHSFCSRLLKQASESLSMENFESLEKQKEEMLDTTRKCFITVLGDLNNSTTDDDSWLPYYILGKEAEKRNKQPSVYMEYYMRGVKSLQEIGATYPLKINYSSPSRLCIEVLELHYRIHASILKYIEQHENKPIPISVGKVFTNCIEAWKKGPFSKKPKKDGVETDTESKPAEAVHAANILKRSVSDAGEEETHEAKRLKLESAAAKVRRSASYDTERLSQKETTVIASTEGATETNKAAEEVAPPSDTVIVSTTKEDLPNASEVKPTEEATKESTEKAVEKKDSDTEKKGESSSSTSSSSSSDSSSSDTTSSSSTDSSSTASSKSSNDAKFLTDEEIMKIVGACLDALEDCASRFPPHYKAIYRLAHYHFYYKKGKDIERCRDLMLSNFTSRAGQKLAGLFSEKKHSNFFNNIWKIPHTEVDRAGSFAFHMSRSVQLTMEILKEIDDHKTLLDLSVNLQRTPELDKKYLRDSDREELAQQAFLLCVQSLKGQVTKFSQQDDLRSNDVEKQALKSLTLDIYRAYQRVQKQANSKQLTNLLIEAYKLVCTTPITENMNLVDLSMKYCQALIQERKQQATQASLDKSQAQKKQAPKPAEVAKPAVIVTTNPPKVDPKPAVPASASGLPKISPHDISAAFQNYLPMLNDPVMSQQAAAALSLTYLSNALSGYGYQNTLQSSLQTTLQNSFQAEYYRQLMGLSSFGMPPQKKQKRGPKPGAPRAAAPSKAKSFAGSAAPPVAKVAPQVAKVAPQVAKAAPTPVITSLQKAASATLAPSMGTVLPTLPASMTANLSSFGASHSAHSSAPAHAHLPSSLTSTTLHSKPPLPHQQVSPGKTLQEKLAERQKNTKSSAQDITASISKLPSSLTITKTSVSKPPVVQSKKPEVKKSLSFTEPRPKQISTDEVIVLDDDD